MTDPRDERWRPTGATAGPLGIDGEYLPSERATAHRLLTFLSDRRVLFAPYDMEDPTHCVYSVLEIRSFLTDLLTDWPTDSALHQHLLMLRAACREFLDAVDPMSEHRHGRELDPNSPGTWLDGLGRLRTHFGYHVAAIMGAYDLSIEDHLGVILPPSPQATDVVVPSADKYAQRFNRSGAFFWRLWRKEGW